MVVPEMPTEFKAHDGHSTLEERQAAWAERVAMLLEAFPGAEFVLPESEAA